MAPEISVGTRGAEGKRSAESFPGKVLPTHNQFAIGVILFMDGLRITDLSVIEQFTALYNTIGVVSNHTFCFLPTNFVATD